MIELTRLNGTVVFVNPDLIVTVEPTPDTVITLTTGDKLVVREAPQVIIDGFVALKRRMLADGFEVLPRQSLD